MFALLKQTRTGFFIAMIGLMFTSIISPVLALSASDLAPGDDAVVATDTRLYSDTSRDADVTAEVARDTPVSIVEGPFTTDDGTQWYWVRVYDQTGYMPAIDIQGVEPAPATEEAVETETEAETAPTRPWQEPIDYGVANDNVKCRVDVSTSSEELIRVAPGQTIEITGKEVWGEGIAWLPVNCAGVGGFIASDYITLDTATEAATEVATEAPVETEVATEVVTETQVATEVVTETQVATEAVTETQAATEVVQNGAAAVPGQTETVEALTASAAGEPIGSAVAIDDVVCRVDATTSAPQITVVVTGQSIDITGTAVSAEGLDWTPVNCAGVGGFVASQYIDAGTADAATEVATEETTEATEAAADETTEATEEATDEATTESTEAAADETATGEATDVASATPAAGTATPDATEEATNEATVEPTDAATNEATAEATDEATDEATEETTEELLGSGQAVTETESTMPVEDSAIIGTGEIRGPDGAGVACRVAPDYSAPVIRVLPEGLNALVLSAPDSNGWMSIICNGEVGYVHSTYVYSGGAASDFSADTSSYATVDATGGAGLNCRSGPGTGYSVIGYFPAGSGVNVTGAAQGDWVPVICGGQNGWVYGAYVIPASAPSTGGDTGNTGTGGNTDATTSTMVVSGTNGDSLYCRATPGGTPITLMAEGTRVSVRGAAEGGWVPIICAGQNGYASEQFLSAASTGDSNTGGDTTKPSTGDSGGVSSGTVTVTGTGGARLNCRTAPNGTVITSVAEGTVLNVRGAAEGGWLPVECGGNAWVSSMYVTAGGTAPGGDSGTGTTPPPTNGGSNPDASTGTATVVNTQGDSLRCRVEPNGATITMLPPGSTVSLRAEKSGDWQGVICAGQNGFAHSAYLSIGGSSDGGTTNPTPTEPDPKPAGLGNGDHARVTSTLNLRYEPSTGAGIATSAPAGTVVLITGNVAAEGYYPVNWDGLKGYMHGDWLVKTDEALSKRGGSAQPTDPPTSGGGGGSATGNAIVDYALGYVGYPYVWATHGPYSFDCSGFTSWVIQNVVGKSIGYSVWPQLSAGTPVSRSNLQPGDLVFFQNTYKAGVSHVGIYIGGDQFVHAENENTGVKISSLSSNYYGSRWYGAVRVT